MVQGDLEADRPVQFHLDRLVVEAQKAPFGHDEQRVQNLLHGASSVAPCPMV